MPPALTPLDRGLRVLTLVVVAVAVATAPLFVIKGERERSQTVDRNQCVLLERLRATVLHVTPEPQRAQLARYLPAETCEGEQRQP